MMSCEKLKHQVSQDFLSHDMGVPSLKEVTLYYNCYIPRGCSKLIYSLTTVKYCDLLHHLLLLLSDIL